MTGRYSSCSASKDYLQEMALEETDEFAGLIEVHNCDYESGSTDDEIET